MTNADMTEKTVVVTGGATGIGFGLAKATGALGAKVIIAEPDPERLRRATEALERLGIESAGYPCDVTDLEQVEALADFAWATFDRVDLVVNNAGVGLPAVPVAETSMADLRNVFEVNFFGVWHGCRVFAPRLIEQGTPAAIYNTGSENSLFNAVPNLAGYVASKHAVLGLTDSLREQVPEYITIGVIIPGLVASELTRRVADLAMDTDEYARRVVEQILQKQFYVVTHAYNIEHVDRRHKEISEAYAKYAPRYEGDDEHDVRTLLRKLADN